MQTIDLLKKLEGRTIVTISWDGEAGKTDMTARLDDGTIINIFKSVMGGIGVYFVTEGDKTNDKMKDILKYYSDAYDSVYRWDEEQNAYVFVGKLLGRTEEEFIKDYEGRSICNE